MRRTPRHSNLCIRTPRLQYLGHVYRALTAPKNGPTVYELCDPLLLGPGSGDAHLRKFYKTAIANPALRTLLSRAGLPKSRSAVTLKR